ncbi:hypothetical protein [Yunchengibacter salinarum]|uniref:hypothetical protein n=1 Tax=Yunchengibacter salinarum TaxID=3133399 RepID=UPI0035B5A98A
MAGTFTVMMRRLGWLVLGVALVAFSVVNREAVPLAIPFVGSLAVPLFLIFYAGIFFGLLVAGLITGWLRLKGFTRRRQAERRARHLEKQVGDLSEDAHRFRAAQAHARASDGDGRENGTGDSMGETPSLTGR